MSEPITEQNCAREPIHIPGSIQSHGVLIAFDDKSLKISHVSSNVSDYLKVSSTSLLGTFLPDLFEGHDSFFSSLSKVESFELINPFTLNKKIQSCNIAFEATISRSKGFLLLELQRQHDSDLEQSELHRNLNSYIKHIHSGSSINDVSEQAARAVKNLCQYDRVMIYQFDENYNGRVVAEEKELDQEPFLGLHYPASDIPSQARALYGKNWVRIIPDVSYTPVAIETFETQPLDLSFSMLRSVSPIHIQYLKNMGVAASASVSIIVGGKLWGLICFHHRKPRILSDTILQALVLIGKFLSSQIAALENIGDFRLKQTLRTYQEQLESYMKEQPKFLDGLHLYAPTFLNLIEGASGGAICYRNKIERFGETPSEPEIKELVYWLGRNASECAVFKTQNLGSKHSDFKKISWVASGLLAISIPEPEPSYVMWFKPEVVQMVTWGGDPTKSTEIDQRLNTLSPRKSFAQWQQKLEGESLPWRREEVEAVEMLRRSIIEIDLTRQVRSALESNKELDHFADVISHDLKEPIRGIAAYAKFLEEDITQTLPEEAATNLQGIRDLADQSLKLIQRVFDYSRLGKIDLSFAKTNIESVVHEALSRLNAFLNERHAKVKIVTRLPEVYCDQARIGEVFSNLISNAAKYNRLTEKRIEIGAEESGANHYIFFVRDNGIGIREQDRERIFKLFERLHEPNEFGGGTGTGLTIVKRIVDRHGGHIWIDSRIDDGTTFYFTLQPEMKKPDVY